MYLTTVKGHAEEGMVFDGRVRELDRLRNNAAGGSVLLLSMLVDLYLGSVGMPSSLCQ